MQVIPSFNSVHVWKRTAPALYEVEIILPLLEGVAWLLNAVRLHFILGQAPLVG